MNQQTVRQLSPHARIFCGLNTDENKYNIKPVVAVSKPKRQRMEKSEKLSTGPKRKHIDMDKFIDMYNKDFTLVEMAAHFSVCSATVFNVIEQQVADGKMVARIKKFKPRINLDEPVFVERYNSGMTYRKMAEEHSVSARKIQTYIRELLDAGKIEKRKRSSKD